MYEVFLLSEIGIYSSPTHCGANVWSCISTVYIHIGIVCVVSCVAL